LKPQEVANLAWAFATAEHKAPILFDALAKHALSIMPTLKAQGVANLAWAFAKQQLAAPALFDALVPRAVAVADVMNSQDVAMFSLACATIALPAPTWFAALARRPSQFTPGINAQGIANLAWSYAVQLALTTGPSDGLRAVLRSLLAELGRHDATFWSTMSDEGVMQLAQAHETLTAHPDRPVSESVPALPAVIAQQALAVRTRRDRDVRGGDASTLVKEVITALRELKLRIDKEVIVGDMLVDLRVHLASGSTVLVEVDGPFHFVADATAPSGWRTNGATRLKHTRLTWQAEPFVAVSQYEWHSVKHHANRRRQFFESLLARASSTSQRVSTVNRADNPVIAPPKGELRDVPALDLFSFQSAPGHPPAF
jgi:hypothetical protein